MKSEYEDERDLKREGLEHTCEFDSGDFGCKVCINNERERILNDLLKYEELLVRTQRVHSQINWARIFLIRLKKGLLKEVDNGL